MRIGINILYLIPGKVGGTETYARNLIPSLSHHLQKGDQLVVFASRETAPTFSSTKNTKIVTLPFYAENRYKRLLFEQILLPFYCLRYKIDILFSLGYSQPIFLPCKSVVTIHDLNWYYHPEDFSFFARLIWNLLTRLSAFATNHIITDSQSSLESIKNILHIKKNKITKILHAAPPPLKITQTNKKPSYPYLFSVLALHPHKNLITLIKAFAKLSQKYPNLHLVIAGLGGKASPQIKDYLNSHEISSKIKILGYVSDTKLGSLYQKAQVFVFPSAYEGFGYPVLEAMSYGVPVVSSSATSLKEVVADGGVLVDPYDIDQYVNAIDNILRSPSRRKSLIKKGFQRLKKLSWDKTALSTLKVIKNTLAK